MEYRCGIWKQVAKSGVEYCSGKIKIGSEEYQVRLFSNDKRGNEKAPDFNLIIKNEGNVLTKEKSVEIAPKNSVPSDDGFIAFGNSIEFDDDMPF